VSAEGEGDCGGRRLVVRRQREALDGEEEVRVRGLENKSE